MNSKLIEQKQNPLFHRKEVMVEIEAKGATPRRSEVVAELAEKLGAPATQIAVAKVDHKFGRHYVVVAARVYDSPEQLKKFEHEWVLARGTGKKKAKGEKKEGKKEAKPAAQAAPAEK